jgi:AraC-like DNA-binding protein
VDPEAEGVFDRLETALHDVLDRSVRDSLFDRLSDVIQQAEGRVSIGRLAKAAGVSTRSLERHFRERAGVSAKTLQRLARLSAALRALPTVEPLADLAHRLGYFDQAHLTNEFRLFSGVSPGRYRTTPKVLDRLFVEG